MYQEGQRIELEDGTVGTIIEVLGDGAEYDVEIATPDGPHAYEWKTVHPKDIKGLHRPKSQRSETQDRGHPRGWPSSCRERGQIPYFKDAATPANVADGGGVTGYAATGSSPARGGSAPKQHLRAQSIRRCAITSQNGTAPKRTSSFPPHMSVRLPVRTALLQNQGIDQLGLAVVRLPVRTALLQNVLVAVGLAWAVRLPVRTALLQNTNARIAMATKCDYQSERHCSKTSFGASPRVKLCDYQSERHCSKTLKALRGPMMRCDYQSERHCSKT